MAKVTNLAAYAAKNNDGRICYVRLPAALQNTMMAAITLASHDGDTDSWRGAQGTHRSAIAALDSLYSAAEKLGIPGKTVDAAMRWAEDNVALALRSRKKLPAGPSPTAG